MNQLKENNLATGIMEPMASNNLYELMFTNYPDVVNVEELTKMLDIGITLAYRLVKKGIIQSLKVGRAYKIPKSHVISYLMNQSKS